MSEIQSADPKARKQALRLIAVLAVVGTLVLLLSGIYQPQLEAWLVSDTVHLQTRLSWIFSVLIVSLFPLLFAVIYIWRMGSAVSRARRFPPPGFAVVKDTQVVEGRKARSRGILLNVLAVLLGAGTLAVPIMFCSYQGLFSALDFE